MQFREFVFLSSKRVFALALLFISVSLTGCTFLFDEAHGYRGPVEITIKTEDGSIPQFPFLIDTGYAEPGGHGGSGRERGYDYLKLAYAGKVVTFPRERLDLLQPNAYAMVHFVVRHPNYHIQTLSVGLGPIDADDPHKLTITVKPFEDMMQVIAERAEVHKVNRMQFQPDSREYKSADYNYRRVRYVLGRAIHSQIDKTRDVYLPELPLTLQQEVIDKYQPIFKKWYYSVPETDCHNQVLCKYRILEPRRKEYKGL